ncbi:MAG TPA: glutamate-1-semialdehyde 2,1-aminomutase [Burkholderiales bacterium]|nr:glutamate-1-semialdehyde 2,1-aminomutase [Burkholderiales bacterium]
MTNSQTLFERALKRIPGGVNSPVRAFGAVGGTPRFIARGEGPYVWDVEGKRYLDYVGSWGPLIVGHAHPRILAAVQQAAARGLGFGAPTELEVEMAETLCRLLPSMEQVRLVSSGTEATMSAIRLARGFTGRNVIVKFQGCYHGHADALLVKAGSGALTFTHPSSAGVPGEVAAQTLVLEFNDSVGLERAFGEYGSKIAALIVEPVAGNMNLIAAVPEFLRSARELCSRYGALLVFDEVMTGFRVGLSGAQGFYEIVPDLTTLGKVIGGGLPVGAFGGRREVMAKLAPLGAVYQAGTLSGNPVAVAAGLATLELVQEPEFYKRLSETCRMLTDRLAHTARRFELSFSAQAVGGMFGVYFREHPPRSFAEVMQCDVQAFTRFFHAMVKRGFYFAPSAFEVGFVSSAHTQADIEATISAAEEVFSDGLT